MMVMMMMLSFLQYIAGQRLNQQQQQQQQQSKLSFKCHLPYKIRTIWILANRGRLDFRMDRSTSESKWWTYTNIFLIRLKAIFLVNISTSEKWPDYFLLVHFFSFPIFLFSLSLCPVDTEIFFLGYKMWKEKKKKRFVDICSVWINENEIENFTFITFNTILLHFLIFGYG